MWHDLIKILTHSHSSRHIRPKITLHKTGVLKYKKVKQSHHKHETFNPLTPRNHHRDDCHYLSPIHDDNFHYSPHAGDVHGGDGGGDDDDCHDDETYVS